MSCKIEEKNGTTRIIAEAHTIKEAFTSGAKGLFSLEHDIDKVGDSERLKIAIDAKDLSGLFATWLRVLTERKKSENLILGDFRVASLQKVNDAQYLLTGEAFGEVFDPSRHQKKKEILSISEGACSAEDDNAHCECSVELKDR